MHSIVRVRLRVSGVVESCIELSCTFSNGITLKGSINYFAVALILICQFAGSYMELQVKSSNFGVSNQSLLSSGVPPIHL